MVICKGANVSQKTVLCILLYLYKKVNMYNIFYASFQKNCIASEPL